MGSLGVALTAQFPVLPYKAILSDNVIVKVRCSDYSDDNNGAIQSMGCMTQMGQCQLDMLCYSDACLSLSSSLSILSQENFEDFPSRQSENFRRTHIRTVSL